MKTPNASEAISGFAAWLSTRKEQTVFGSYHNSSLICPLIREFCDANNLPEVTDSYPENIKMPSESF